MLYISEFRILFEYSASTKSSWNTSTSGTVHQKPTDGTGVVFNKVKTVILAERYDYAIFLLPFPKLDPSFEDHFQNVTDTLQEYWNAVPGDCPELKDRVVDDEETHRLLGITGDAFALARQDLNKLQKELDELLQPPPQSERKKRLAVLTVAAAAAAGAGLLTLGAHLTDTCIAGVLGPCHNEERIRANEEDISIAIQRLNLAERKWATLSDRTAKSFYIVATELNKIN